MKEKTEVEILEKGTKSLSLASKRFVPLFLVQLLGAFNDNLFKNAFVMLVTFSVATQLGWSTAAAINTIMALFLLPFFLFSALAGQISDKYDKSIIIRISKFGELGIMILAAFAFFTNNIILLFSCTFLTGLQSTFFGPIKYAILPQHLSENQLVKGTALIEASTFIAILSGTILGGLAFFENNISDWLPISLIVIAVIGLIASYFVPKAPPYEELKINWDPIKATKNIIASVKPQIGIWRTILGLSWFWAVGAILISFIPTYVSEHLNSNNLTATYFLAVFCLGIGIGTGICHKLLNGSISAKYVPIAGLFISIGIITFVLSSVLIPFETFSLYSIGNIVISSCLLTVAIASGIYSVPLYAILQAWSKPAECARNIAANNIINALFIVCMSVIVAIFHIIGISGFAILSAVAAINLAVSIYIIKIIPEAFLHTFLRWILKLLFRVKIEGIENYTNVAGNKIIIANHVSYLDAALLTAFLPEVPTFAINTQVAQKWWIRPLLNFVRCIPVDPSNPMAIKTLTNEVKKGVPVVIFPEGRLTITGRLMKMYEGPGVMALHANAAIIPIQIQGAEQTKFSYLKNKIRQIWLPNISIRIFPSCDTDIFDQKNRKSRGNISTKIYEILSSIAFESLPKNQYLFEALLKSANKYGQSTKILTDHTLETITYRQLIAKSLTLAAQLTSTSNDPIGLLLPNSKAACVCLFALQAKCQPTALLNFSLGASNLLSTCKTAKISIVWTSRKFIQAAKLEESVNALEANNVAINYLEDIQQTPLLKMQYCLNLIFTKYLATKTLAASAKNKNSTCDSPSIILFTSGSSGLPKAVVLSHKNITSNIQQLFSQIDINADDKVFNCLPMFHSFGLTGGTLSPLFNGVPTILYPSPIHYRIIPELVYQTSATVMFGTNTFLNGYSKKAHCYDFHSVRYIFAGAEKVKPETKTLWAEVFGVRILEGYGTTECSPAISMNTPLYNEAGSVGKLLPGIKYKLEEISGISAGKKLIVAGPNIMLGYYLPENPGVLVPPEDNWYDTGDIVELSDQGFLRIIGRAKRFAKIGGEMISLTAVEELASKTWPNTGVAAVNIQHSTKGEEIILFVDFENAERISLIKKAKELGHSEMLVPKKIIIQNIPTLASGKPDYVTLTKQVEANIETDDG